MEDLERLNAIQKAQRMVSEVLTCITDQFDQISIGRSTHDRGITLEQERELRRLDEKSNPR